MILFSGALWRVGAGSGLSTGAGSTPCNTPRHAAGAGATNTDPHHSGTVQSRKGGPLWLQVQAYVQHVTLCQDHLLVLTTGVLVSTRTGFPPQLRGSKYTAIGVPTVGGGDSSDTSSGDLPHSPGFVTVGRRPSTGSAVRSSELAVQLASGLPATPGW